jgi:8-oxo-dGTP pyrophosphatase MutT (NUDIX family)
MAIFRKSWTWSNLGYLDNVETLSEVLQPFSDRGDADAAVALLLKIADQDLKILFVKRVENPKDPWSGHVALPGGRRNEEDRNLKETVVRETLEETSINLLDRSRFLGSMTPLRLKHRPMKILCFIVLLEHEPAIKLNEKELESSVWISLKELTQHKGTFKSVLGEFPAYIVGDTVIWGLTYRILEKFIQIIGLH